MQVIALGPYFSLVIGSLPAFLVSKHPGGGAYGMTRLLYIVDVIEFPNGLDEPPNARRYASWERQGLSLDLTTTSLKEWRSHGRRVSRKTTHSALQSPK